MTAEWLDAYEAGVFTEFQEQRAPGHTVLGDKIYKKGMLGIIEDIHRSISTLDFLNDREAYEKREELLAMEITANALIRYAERHAEILDGLHPGKKILSEGPSLSAWPWHAAGYQPIPRVPCMRRCSFTGSCIWA